jgi:hypothetical protein
MPEKIMERHVAGKLQQATQYRKIVGKIMYLVCNLIPEGSNAARELLRQFRSLNAEHWKEAERFVGYQRQEQSDVHRM